MRSRGPEVRVVARFKPLSEEENAHHKDKKISPMCVIYDQQNIEVLDRMHHAGAPPSPYFSKVAKQSGPINEMAKNFTIDEVFSDTTTQAQIHERVGRPIVKNVLKGYNGTVLAYGQTGSGKTHSMMGPAGGGLDVFSVDSPHYKMRGMVPRMVEELFQRLHAIPSTERTWTVAVSIFEIYREDILDLLSPSSNSNSTFGSDGNGAKERYRIREDLLSGQGIYIESLEKPEVQTAEEVIALIRYAANKRKTAVTNINETSSRSHSLVVIYLDQMDYTSVRDGQRIVSRLNLVDLAGSEKLHKTNAVGERLEEAKKINLSLTLLGNVIYKLTDGKSGYVPYRDSKLTRILQESLGGNSITTLVCHCSIAMYNREETLSTLRFAQRAKRVRNKPQINKDLSAKELKLQLVAAEHKIISLENKLQVKSDIIARLRDSREAQDDELQSLIESLMRELEQLREELGIKEEELAHERSRCSLYQREAESMTALCEKERQEHAKQLQLLQGMLGDTQDENKALRQQLADLQQEWQRAVAAMNPGKEERSTSPVPWPEKSTRWTNTEVPYPEKATTENLDSTLNKRRQPSSPFTSGSPSRRSPLHVRRALVTSSSTTTHEDQIYCASFLLGRPNTAELEGEKKRKLEAGEREGMAHLNITEEGEETLSLVGPFSRWLQGMDGERQDGAGEKRREGVTWEEEENKKEWVSQTEQNRPDMKKDSAKSSPMSEEDIDGRKRGQCPACGHTVLLSVKTKTQGTCTPPLSTLLSLPTGSSAPLLLPSSQAVADEKNALIPFAMHSGAETSGQSGKNGDDGFFRMERPLNNDEIRRILHTASAFIQTFLLNRSSSPPTPSLPLETNWKRARGENEDLKVKGELDDSNGGRKIIKAETPQDVPSTAYPLPSSSSTAPRAPSSFISTRTPPQVFRAVAFLVELLHVIGQAVREDPRPLAAVVQGENHEKNMKNESMNEYRGEVEKGNMEDGIGSGEKHTSTSAPSYRSHPHTQELHSAQEALQEALCMAARVLNAWRQNSGELFPENFVVARSSSCLVPGRSTFSHPSSLLHSENTSRLGSPLCIGCEEEEENVASLGSALLPPMFFAHEQLLSLLVLEDMRQRLIRRSVMQVKITSEKRFLGVQQVLRTAVRLPIAHSLWLRHALPQKLWNVVSTHFPSPPLPHLSHTSSSSSSASVSTHTPQATPTTPSPGAFTHYSSPLWKFLPCALDDMGKTLETELDQVGEECWGNSVSAYLSGKVSAEKQAHGLSLRTGIIEMTARMEEMCMEALQFSSSQEEQHENLLQESGNMRILGVEKTEMENKPKNGKRPNPNTLLCNLAAALGQYGEKKIEKTYREVLSSMVNSKRSWTSSEEDSLPFLSPTQGDVSGSENVKDVELFSRALSERTASVCEHVREVGKVHINAIIAQFPSFLRKRVEGASVREGKMAGLDGKEEEETVEQEDQALVNELRELLLQTVEDEIRRMCSQREEEVMQEVQRTIADAPAWISTELEKQKEEMKEIVSREIQELLAKMAVLARYEIPQTLFASEQVREQLESEQRKAQPCLSRHVGAYDRTDSVLGIRKIVTEGGKDAATLSPATSVAAHEERRDGTTTPSIPTAEVVSHTAASRGDARARTGAAEQLKPSQLETLVYQLRLVGLHNEEGVGLVRRLLIGDNNNNTLALSLLEKRRENSSLGVALQKEDVSLGLRSVPPLTSLQSELSSGGNGGQAARGYPFALVPPRCWRAVVPYVREAVVKLYDNILQEKKKDMKKSIEMQAEVVPTSLHSHRSLSLLPPSVMELMALPAYTDGFPLGRWKKAGRIEKQQEDAGESQEVLQEIIHLWEEEMRSLYSDIHSRLIAVMRTVRTEQEGVDGDVPNPILQSNQISLLHNAIYEDEIEFFTTTLTSAALGVWWDELQRDANKMPISLALDRYIEKLRALTSRKLEDMRPGHTEMVQAARRAFAYQLRENTVASSLMQELHEEHVKKVKERMSSIAEKCCGLVLQMKQQQEGEVEMLSQDKPSDEEVAIQNDIRQWCATAEERLLHSLRTVEDQECASIARELAQEEMFSSSFSSVLFAPAYREGVKKIKECEDEGREMDAVLHDIVRSEWCAIRNNLEDRIVRQCIEVERSEPATACVTTGGKGEEGRVWSPFRAPTTEGMMILGNRLDLLHLANEEMSKKKNKDEKHGKTMTENATTTTSDAESSSLATNSSLLVSVLERVIEAGVQRFLEEATNIILRQEQVICQQQALLCQRLLHLFSLTPTALLVGPTLSSSSSTAIRNEEKERGSPVHEVKTSFRGQEQNWLKFVEEVLKGEETEVEKGVGPANPLESPSPVLTTTQQEAIARGLTHLYQRITPANSLIRFEAIPEGMQEEEAQKKQCASASYNGPILLGGKYPFPFGAKEERKDVKDEEERDTEEGDETDLRQRMHFITNRLLWPDRHPVINQTQLNHLSTVLTQQLQEYLRQLLSPQEEQRVSTLVAEMEDDVVTGMSFNNTNTSVSGEESFLSITPERTEAIVSQLQSLCVREISQTCADHAMADEMTLQDIQQYIMSTMCHSVPMVMKGGNIAGVVFADGGTPASRNLSVEEIISMGRTDELHRRRVIKHQHNEGYVNDEDVVIMLDDGDHHSTPYDRKKNLNEAALTSIERQNGFPHSQMNVSLLREVDRICEELFTTSPLPSPPPSSDGRKSSSSIRSSSLLLQQHENVGMAMEEGEKREQRKQKELVYVTPAQLSFLRGKLMELAIGEQRRCWADQQALLADRVENMVVARLREEQIRDNFDRMECFQRCTFSMMEEIVANLMRAITEAQMWERRDQKVEERKEEQPYAEVHEEKERNVPAKWEGAEHELPSARTVDSGGMLFSLLHAQNRPVTAEVVREGTPSVSIPNEDAAAVMRKTPTGRPSGARPPLFSSSVNILRQTPRRYLSSQAREGEEAGALAPGGCGATQIGLLSQEVMKPWDVIKGCSMISVHKVVGSSADSLFMFDEEPSIVEQSVHVAHGYVQELMAAQVEQSWKETVLHAQPYIVIEEEIAELPAGDLKTLAKHIRMESVERATSLRQASRGVFLPSRSPSSVYPLPSNKEEEQCISLSASSVAPLSYSLGQQNRLEDRVTPRSREEQEEEGRGPLNSFHVLSPEVYSNLCEQIERRAEYLQEEKAITLGPSPLSVNEQHEEEVTMDERKVPILQKNTSPMIERLGQQILDLRAPELALLTHRFATHMEQEYPTLPEEEEVIQALQLLVAYLQNVSLPQERVEEEQEREAEAKEPTSDLHASTVFTTAVVHPGMNPSVITRILDLVKDAIEEEKSPVQKEAESATTTSPAPLSSTTLEDAWIKTLVHRGTSPAFPSSPPDPPPQSESALRDALASLQDWCTRLQDLSTVLENAVVQEVKSKVLVSSCSPAPASRRGSSVFPPFFSVSPVRQSENAVGQHLPSTPNSIANFQLFLQNTPKDPKREGVAVHPISFAIGREPVALLRDYCAAAQRQSRVVEERLRQVDENDANGEVEVVRGTSQKGEGESSSPMYIGLELPEALPCGPLICMTPYLTHRHHVAEVIELRDQEAHEEVERHGTCDEVGDDHLRQASEVQYISMISMMRDVKAAASKGVEGHVVESGSGDAEGGESYKMAQKSCSPSCSLPKQKLSIESVLSEAQILADMNALQAVELVLCRHIGQASLRVGSDSRGPSATPTTATTTTTPSPSLFTSASMEKQENIGIKEDKNEEDVMLAARTVLCVIERASYRLPIEQQQFQGLLQIYGLEMSAYFPAFEPPISKGKPVASGEKQATRTDVGEINMDEEMAEGQPKEVVQDPQSGNGAPHSERHDQDLIYTLQSLFYLQQHLRKHPFQSKRALLSLPAPLPCLPRGHSGATTSAASSSSSSSLPTSSTDSASASNSSWFAGDNEGMPLCFDTLVDYFISQNTTVLEALCTLYDSQPVDGSSGNSSTWPSIHEYMNSTLFKNRGLLFPSTLHASPASELLQSDRPHVHSLSHQQQEQKEGEDTSEECLFSLHRVRAMQCIASAVSRVLNFQRCFILSSFFSRVNPLNTPSPMTGRISAPSAAAAAAAFSPSGNVKELAVAGYAEEQGTFVSPQYDYYGRPDGTDSLVVSRSPSAHPPFPLTTTSGVEGFSFLPASSNANPLYPSTSAEGGECGAQRIPFLFPSIAHNHFLPLLLEEREKMFALQKEEAKEKSNASTAHVGEDGVSSLQRYVCSDTSIEESAGRAVDERKSQRWSGREANRVLWVGQNLGATLTAQMKLFPPSLAPFSFMEREDASRDMAGSLEKCIDKRHSEVSPVSLPLSLFGAPCPTFPSSVSVASPTMGFSVADQMQLFSMALRYLSEVSDEESHPSMFNRNQEKKNAFLLPLHDATLETTEVPMNQGMRRKKSSTSKRSSSYVHVDDGKKGLFSSEVACTGDARKKEEEDEELNAVAACHSQGDDPVWNLLRRDDVRAALLAFLKNDKNNEEEEEKDEKRRRNEKEKNYGVMNGESLMSSSSTSSLSPSAEPRENLLPVMDALEVPVIVMEEEWHKAMNLLDLGLHHLEEHTSKSQTPQRRISTSRVTVDELLGGSDSHRKEAENHDASAKSKREGRAKEVQGEQCKSSPHSVDHTGEAVRDTESITEEESGRMVNVGVSTRDKRRENHQGIEVGTQTEPRDVGPADISEELKCLSAAAKQVEQLLECGLGVSREELEEMKQCASSRATKDADWSPKSLKLQNASHHDNGEEQEKQKEEECQVIECTKDRVEVLPIFLDRLGREIGFLKKVREPFWQLAVEDREKLLAGIFDAMRELSHALQKSTLEASQKQEFFNERLRCFSSGGFKPSDVLTSVDDLRHEVEVAEQKMKQMEADVGVGLSTTHSDTLDGITTSSFSSSPQSSPTTSEEKVMLIEGKLPTHSLPPHKVGRSSAKEREARKSSCTHVTFLAAPNRCHSTNNDRAHPLQRPPSPLILQSLTVLQEIAQRHSISNFSPPSAPLPSFSARATNPNHETPFREKMQNGALLMISSSSSSPSHSPSTPPSSTALSLLAPTSPRSSAGSNDGVSSLRSTNLQKKAAKAPKEVVRTLQQAIGWMNDLQSLHYGLMQQYLERFQRAEKLEDLLEKSKYERDDSKQELDAVKLILESKDKENQNMKSILEEMNIDLEVYLSDLEHQKRINARLAKKASQLQNQASLLATTADQQEFCDMAGLELTIRTEEMYEIEAALENVLTFYDADLISKKRQHIGKTIRSIGTFCQKMLSMCQSRPRFNTGTLESQRLNILQGTAELYNRFEWAKEELNEQLQRQKAGISR